MRLVYPTVGRGAWPANGAGQTLNSTGDSPGPYLRCPAVVPNPRLMPGLAAFRDIRNGEPVSINEFAVMCAVQAIQREVNVTDDGLFGGNTAAAVKTWQQHHALTGDGIVGPATGKALWRPVALELARTFSTRWPPTLAKLVVGHIGHESGWDSAAVGVTTPQDLGLCQINGPAHPDMSAQARLDPRRALVWMMGFVEGNLNAFGGNEAPAIAAYLLGVTGSRRWSSAGFPDVFNGVKVHDYVASVLKAAR